PADGETVRHRPPEYPRIPHGVTEVRPSLGIRLGRTDGAGTGGAPTRMGFAAGCRPALHRGGSGLGRASRTGAYRGGCSGTPDAGFIPGRKGRTSYGAAGGVFDGA